MIPSVTISQTGEEILEATNPVLGVWNRYILKAWGRMTKPGPDALHTISGDDFLNGEMGLQIIEQEKMLPFFPVSLRLYCP